MLLKRFRLVTTDEPHTGTAIFEYRGHAIYLEPASGGVSSSLRVFVAKNGVRVGVAEFTALATVQGVVDAKDYIDDKLANALGEPREAAADEWDTLTENLGKAAHAINLALLTARQLINALTPPTQTAGRIDTPEEARRKGSNPPPPGNKPDAPPNPPGRANG